MNRPPYAQTNEQLATRLLQRIVRSIVRYTSLRPDEPLRSEWGPLLLCLDNDLHIMLTVDEGRQNMLLFDASPQTQTRQNLERKQSYPFEAEAESALVIKPLLEGPITSVERVSRKLPEAQNGWQCGLRLIASGHALLVGCYLTPDAVPNVEILFPDEVVQGLNLHPLQDR